MSAVTWQLGSEIVRTSDL